MEHIPTPEKLAQARPDISDAEFIEAGGFKAVFRGTVNGRVEAIKVVYVPPAAQEEGSRDEITRRVKREIEALRLCKTNRLVKLGSIELQGFSIEARDYLIYSEEFLKGETLKARMARGHRPDTPEIISLAHCLMEALREIERIGHIHRDVKPGNIIALAESERPFVLLDLGIAFKLHGTELTVRGSGPPGTLLYMAPELFRPDYKEALDIRSDIYSAGVTIFEYVAGQHPLARRGEDLGTTVYRILRQPPPRLATLRPDLPERLCNTIDRCIKKMPALRYRNPEAVLKQLEETT
jgi:eukaryotic-like serine/threonine-protein kinase